MFAYYEHRRHEGGPSAAEKADAHKAHQARALWTDHRRVYGTRRLTAELRHRGLAWNQKKVARLIRLSGIEGAHRRHRGKYGECSTSTTTAPDLVERQLTAGAPNKLWVAEIKYLRTWEGLLYLAVVNDACSCKVVGWAIADDLRTELVQDAVGMALNTGEVRPWTDPPRRPIEPRQYTAYECGQLLRTSRIPASMGRVGSAFGNTMAEAYILTLKTELDYRRSLPTRHEFEMLVFSNPEGFYKPRRRYSRRDYLSPTDYEQQFEKHNEASV